MSGEQIRAIGGGTAGAILSAIIAALIFHWQVKHWSRWIPKNVGKKGQKQLLEEYRGTIRIAKVLSMLGFLLGCLFYATGWMSKYDWRGLGIGFALASFLPVFFIVMTNIFQGTEKIREAMVAFVIDQKTPPKILFVFMGLSLAWGVASVVSLMLRPL